MNEPQRGTIEVAPKAIATMAGRAALAIPGVVGIAGRTLRFGGAELLPPERFSNGIIVRFAEDRITIQMYLIIEHGQRITDVAHQAMVAAKAAVEQMLGLPVVRVNITVQGLRVSDPTS